MIRVCGAPIHPPHHPPSTLSSALSQLRTKGFFGRLWNWASCARVNAAMHLFFKKKNPNHTGKLCSETLTAVSFPFLYFLNRSLPVFRGLGQ